MAFITGSLVIVYLLQPKLANFHYFFQWKSLFRSLTWVVAIGFTVIAYRYSKYCFTAFYLQFFSVVSSINTFHWGSVNTLCTTSGYKETCCQIHLFLEPSPRSFIITCFYTLVIINYRLWLIGLEIGFKSGCIIICKKHDKVTGIFYLLLVEVSSAR